MNDKETKKTIKQKKHIFQVHTMHTDGETKQINDKVISSVTENKLPKIKKKNILQKKRSKQQNNNPFLSKESTKTELDTKKGSFAPGMEKEPVEKINQTPADIAPKKEILKKNTVQTQKKMIHIIMIIFIVLFLLGAVGFGVYMLKFNTQKTNNSVILDNVDNIALQKEDVNDDNSNVDTNIDNNTKKTENDIKSENTESTQQLYATDLPNYFSIDVESTTIKQDVSTELQTIVQNMEAQDIVGPISFIVTDQNNNPVSFHVFALSADMDVPQDILTNLEEGFEIYAYNDGVQGVRFGFGIDIKNIQKLQTTITANETKLPKAFDVVLNGLGIKTTGIVFKDSSYKTHPIRYYNLNESESYSIDYTVDNKRWIVGTTKNTLRAIIDTLQEVKVQDTKVIQ